jgi:putative membrane protein
MARASVAMSIKLFVGGIISAASMVIPGISGSFMLVILGLYNLVLNTVSSISSIVVKPSYDLIIHLISVLVPFCIGSLVGVLSISKIIEYILKKIPSYTYFSILGLMLGSIFSIFKDPATYAAHGSIGFIPSITAFILCAIGLLISLKTTNTE